MAYSNKFYIFPEDIGFVIGTRGSTINNIKTTSGSHVQIYKPKSMGGVGEGDRPYFLIQAESQDKISHAYELLESIAQESYNRRHGMFHYSCPLEKRFVPPPKPNVSFTPDASPQAQFENFRYKISPCMCVINLPPNTYGDHISKQVLSGYIGHVCNRCFNQFTHADHVSKDYPITPMNYNPIPKQDRLVIEFSDDECDDEPEQDYKFITIQIKKEENNTYIGKIDFKEFLVKEDGDIHGIVMNIDGKQRNAVFIE